MEIILDVLVDAFVDSIKLIPLLFIIYMIIEATGKYAGDGMAYTVMKAEKFGPLIGGVLGIIPQCGLSSAAASLYSSRIISVGTILAVFLSTSDEMLPLFISANMDISFIFTVLGVKMLMAIVTGYIVDASIRILHLNKNETMEDLRGVGVCACCKNVFVEALKRTLQVFGYIFIFSLFLGLIIELIGQDILASLLNSVPIVSELIAALIGLIPNCASSVIITELYLEGVINAGAMFAGLLVNAGVGLLILYRYNKSKKDTMRLVSILYISGVVWGIIIDLLNLNFLW